jgi:hypothetical protein
VLDYISLAVGTEADLVEVEGGASLAPRVIAARLGLTNLIATASYGGIKVRTVPGTVHCK